MSLIFLSISISLSPPLDFPLSALSFSLSATSSRPYNTTAYILPPCKPSSIELTLLPINPFVASLPHDNLGQQPPTSLPSLLRQDLREESQP
ncbi:hypothetical protein TIFTF001_054415 [Ficus carica]|uniref:Uncharacterized protein n=1 Tax=Ficus carica TaxID=3494 RepID=A0AA88JEX6_FICCA|nr:hypothetical protein TIFTF001_054415 [Ficus carica]